MPSDEIQNSIGQLQVGFIDFLQEISPDDDARLIRIFNVWRQVTFRRAIDLAESANYFFFEGRLLPACTLTQCFVKTVAVQYAVWKSYLLYRGSSSKPGAIRKFSTP